jgi:5-methylcytosine-specific restriction protein A
MAVIPIKSANRPWIKSNIKDNQRQTSEDNRLYHTQQWKRLRLLGLKIEPLCRECKRKGIIKAGTVRDHIVRVKDGGDFWDINNHQTLCNQCHASKSGKEAHL